MFSEIKIIPGTVWASAFIIIFLNYSNMVLPRKLGLSGIGKANQICK